MDKTKYRFVLNVGGRVTYYSGQILNDTHEYYTIQEVREGVIQIFKRNIVTKRVLNEK